MNYEKCQHIEMIKVFMSHPYSSAPFDNTTDSMMIYDKLVDLNFNPFNPLLFHFQQGFKPRDYYYWIRIDLEWLQLCDCVLLCAGWEKSRGCNLEYTRALMLKKPVFYNIDDLKYYYNRNKLTDEERLRIAGL
jgi:hypothetical protein